MYYPWTIPDDYAFFVKSQFERFRERMPSDRCIDVICDYVLKYIAEHRYYPNSPDEAVFRFNNPGLTEQEKNMVIPAVMRLREYFSEYLTDYQLYFATWAALLFCWSQEGDNHVEWCRRYEIQKVRLPAIQSRSVS